MTKVQAVLVTCLQRQAARVFLFDMEWDQIHGACAQLLAAKMCTRFSEIIYMLGVAV